LKHEQVYGAPRLALSMPLPQRGKKDAKSIGYHMRAANFHKQYGSVSAVTEDTASRYIRNTILRNLCDRRQLGKPRRSSVFSGRFPQ